MNQPLVSILVPIYGVEKYIERCAISLFEQTYPNIEYIFVDDATPDHSIAILESVIEKYPTRKEHVRILHHSSNRGISAARNTAVNAASGDYLWQVDSDDYVKIDAVEQLVKKGDEANADIVICDVIEVQENSEKILHAEYKERTRYVKGLIQHIYKCAHWNKFYKTSFYKGTGVNCIETIRLADDYAVTPRLVHQAKRIEVLHMPLYYYETQNQNSYVHNLNRSAIISHHTADCVLVDYFTQVDDKELWCDIIKILKQRSISSLLKHSTTNSWNDISEIYSSDLSSLGEGLKLVDKLIYTLFKNKQDTLLTIFLHIYHIIYSISGK